MKLSEWASWGDGDPHRSVTPALLQLRKFESFLAHQNLRGGSSVDRALVLQTSGRGFDPHPFHHFLFMGVGTAGCGHLPVN